MPASIHTVTRTIMIVKHAAHGATLALIKFGLAFLVAFGDLPYFDNGAFAQLGAPAGLEYGATEAALRIGLGVVF